MKISYGYWQVVRNRALGLFDRLNIVLDQDFCTLSSRQVDNLLAEADQQRYRKPRTANGSRARYFHARLQRQARDRKFSGWT